MILEPSMKIGRHPDVASRVVDGTALLVLPRDGKILTLNETGTFLWERLRRPQAVEALRSELVREFDVDLERADSDLRGFLDELASRGALVVEEQ